MFIEVDSAHYRIMKMSLNCGVGVTSSFQTAFKTLNCYGYLAIKYGHCFRYSYSFTDLISVYFSVQYCVYFVYIFCILLIL